MTLSRRDVLAGAAAIAAVSAIPAAAAFKPAPITAGEQLYMGDVVTCVNGRIYRAATTDYLAGVMMATVDKGSEIAIREYADGPPNWLIHAPHDDRCTNAINTCEHHTNAELIKLTHAAPR